MSYYTTCPAVILITEEAGGFVTDPGILDPDLKQ